MNELDEVARTIDLLEEEASGDYLDGMAPGSVRALIGVARAALAWVKEREKEPGVFVAPVRQSDRDLMDAVLRLG